jgi:hypothetical protein
MGWFERHLNWTIIIITVCSNVISYSLVGLFERITHIPYWGPIYPLGTIDVMLPAFTNFYLDAHLLLTTILSIIGFFWFLKKKNRRWTYILFFTAFLICDFPFFLSYLIIIPNYIGLLSYLLRFVAILLWVIGWIILLALKNKSALLAYSSV